MDTGHITHIHMENDKLKFQYETKITPHESGYAGTVSVANGMVFFFVSEITQSRQSLNGVIEINIQSEEGRKPSFTQRMDMRSNSAIKSLVTDLNNAYGGRREKDGYNWVIILNAFISELSRKIKDSQKPLYVGDIAFEEPSFLLKPFLQTNASNLIFAQSEVGKSWFALRMAVSLAIGKDFLDYKCDGGKKTLYIDYEDSPNAYASRLHKICRGLDVDFKEISKLMPYYKPSGSFRDNVEIIKHTIIKEDISLIIIDAGGDATGGSPSDEQKVLDLFNALEEIEVTKLILHHEPKYVINESSAFYGSMYWKARSRVGWRLEVESQENMSSVIKATIQKRSNLPSQDPFYYQISYDANSLEDFESGVLIPSTILSRIKNADIEVDDIEQKILILIKEEPMSCSNIAEITGMNNRTMRRILTGKLSKKIEIIKSGKSIIYKAK